MTQLKLLKGTCAALLALALSSTMLATPSYAGAKPLNAGKTGTKSNAGAGNGAEAGPLTGSVTVTNTISTSDPTTVIDPNSTPSVVSVPLPATTIDIKREKVGEPYHQNPNNTNSALKQNYLVTTTTTAWDGEKWITTTQTIVVQEVTKQDVTTDTYADLDPGNSGAHNKAPEAPSVDVVTEGPTYVEEVVLGPGEPIVEETGEFTSTDTVTTATDSHPCEGNNAANC